MDEMYEDIVDILIEQLPSKEAIRNLANRVVNQSLEINDLVTTQELNYQEISKLKSELSELRDRNEKIRRIYPDIDSKLTDLDLDDLKRKLAG